jgi:hypothetical protein
MASLPEDVLHHSPERKARSSRVEKVFPRRGDLRAPRIYHSLIHPILSGLDVSFPRAVEMFLRRFALAAQQYC